MKLSKRLVGGFGVAMLLISCAATSMNINSTESYSCDGIVGSYTVQYFESGDAIRLSDSKGGYIGLKKVKSASGQLYSNDGNSFHTNGRDAVLNYNGSEYNCSRI